MPFSGRSASGPRSNELQRARVCSTPSPVKSRQKQSFLLRRWAARRCREPIFIWLSKLSSDTTYTAYPENSGLTLQGLPRPNMSSENLQGSRKSLGQRFSVLCFDICTPLPFLPLSPLWCNFKKKTGTETLTQGLTCIMTFVFYGLKRS